MAVQLGFRLKPYSNIGSYSKVYIIHITKVLLNVTGVVWEGYDETTAVRDIRPND